MNRGIVAGGKAAALLIEHGSKRIGGRNDAPLHRLVPGDAQVDNLSRRNPRECRRLARDHRKAAEPKAIPASPFSGATTLNRISSWLKEKTPSVARP